MGSFLSTPLLRAEVWSLTEQALGIAICGCLVAIIVSNLIEQSRTKLKDLYLARRIAHPNQATRTRTIASGSMPSENVVTYQPTQMTSSVSIASGSIPSENVVTNQPMQMPTSISSDDIERDTGSPDRSLLTLPASNCASKTASAANNMNNSSSQLESEIDPLDSNNTVVSGFWQDTEDARVSPAVSVVASRSVVTSRSILTGQQTVPLSNLSKSTAKPFKPKEKALPIEIEVQTPKEANPIDDLFHAARDAFQERMIRADRELLLETGESLFLLGEMLQVRGKQDEAIEVLQRAEFVQKRAVEKIIVQIATVLRQQGMKIKDRGHFPFLSMTLLGASELLKASPTAANLKACSQVHFEYKPSFQKQNDLEQLVKELDSIFTIVSKDASALAQTLRTQAVCHRQALTEV